MNHFYTVEIYRNHKLEYAARGFNGVDTATAYAEKAFDERKAENNVISVYVIRDTQITLSEEAQ